MPGHLSNDRGDGLAARAMRQAGGSPEVVELAAIRETGPRRPRRSARRPRSTSERMHYAEREDRLLAPYAMRAADSLGRRHPEADHPYRSPYQRDRDRITHSAAFRRLSGKTQVFTGPLAFPVGEGDYHRTRLTHTLEVASIARTVARALRLNEDLVETLALAHDVGHPPFGHAGEEVLDAFLERDGGFDHNGQAVRIFERLEKRYPGYPGLNLTAEVLDGQRSRVKRGPSAAGGSGGAPLLETQVVDAADSLAYVAHDADDALEVGLLGFDDLQALEIWREAAKRAAQRRPAMATDDLRKATVRELIDLQVGDLISHLEARIRELGIDSPQAARDAGVLAAPSAEVAEGKRLLSAFLFANVYRHPIVLSHRDEAADALRATLARWEAEADRLPAGLADVAERESVRRAVADHVSSLTDSAALADPATAGRRGGAAAGTT